MILQHDKNQTMTLAQAPLDTAAGSMPPLWGLPQARVVQPYGQTALHKEHVFNPPNDCCAALHSVHATVVPSPSRTSTLCWRCWTTSESI